MIPTSATEPSAEPAPSVDAARPSADMTGDSGRRRRLPSRRTGVQAVLLVVGAGALIASWDDTLIPVIVSAGIWSPTAVGLGMVLGRAGQISLGQAAMAGLGAYTAMKASGEWGWPGEPVVVAGVVAGVASAAIAAPVLRLRGLYLALATLAYGLIFEHVVVALGSVTGGGTGLGGIRPLRLLGIEIASEEAFLVLAWTSAAGAVLFTALTLRGRFGRALDAIRTDEEMAAALGIAVGRTKIVAWLIAGGFAGLSGVWYAYYNQYISPEQFGLIPSVDRLAAVIVGGPASPVGPAVGELVMNVLPERISLGEDAQALIGPVLLVVFASFFSRGLTGIRR